MILQFNVVSWLGYTINSAFSCSSGASSVVRMLSSSVLLKSFIIFSSNLHLDLFRQHSWSWFLSMNMENLFVSNSKSIIQHSLFLPIFEHHPSSSDFLCIYPFKMDHHRKLVIRVVNPSRFKWPNFWLERFKRFKNYLH